MAEQELKQRFFAQYWGVKCLKNTLLREKIPAHKICQDNCKGDSFQFLELKPLSDISNEDALEAIKTAKAYVRKDGAYITMFSPIENIKESFQDVPIWRLDVADFLRSKGYAVPFMRYSVNDLVELGWIRLLPSIQKINKTKTKKTREEKRKKALSELAKGDAVWCDGDSGFCHLSTEKVTDVSFKFDEATGENYKVIHLGERMFDSRNGNAMNPPLAYYITAL